LAEPTRPAWCCGSLPTNLVFVCRIKTNRPGGGDPMSSQLTEEEVTSLMPSELVPHQTPIPTQIVSSDEFYPDPQNSRRRDLPDPAQTVTPWIGSPRGILNCARQLDASRSAVA